MLELARRTTGWGLVTVALLALAYAFLGPYLPGALAHRGYGFSRLVQHLYLSTEGIWALDHERQLVTFARREKSS